MRHHKQVNLAEHDEASEHYDHWCSGVSCATQDVGINLVDAAENVERGEQIQEQGSVTNHSCLLVKQIDHQAFISQSIVRGVYGEGFDQIKT